MAAARTGWRRRLAIRFARAVVELLETEGGRLHRLLVRLTLRADVADDLLQDLALRLGEADGFAAATNRYAYARAAAMNLAFAWRRQRPTVPVAETLAAPLRPALAGLIQAEELDRMLAAMQKLGDRDRLILTMRYLDARSYAEVAAEVGTTPDRARALCHKAIGRLRNHLSSAEERPGVAGEARREVAR